ncbi:hypothetical protein [Desertivirga brevis]|uniref:hypothetical protein n=1 Tax=Desertivirga brevis TaxID=2810310 RepID=UPI001A96A3C0|nr:hypothetical protein [Pedobacter sp. SYSU D00873]
MNVIEAASNRSLAVKVKKVEHNDFTKITKKRFFFDWKSLKHENELFKLVLVENEDEILGLIAIYDHKEEQRLEIKLLACAEEHVGKEKRYMDVAKCLIAFAGREAIKRHSDFPCISLLPKTSLKHHYIEAYGFLDGGRQIYLEGNELINLIRKYYK